MRLEEAIAVFLWPLLIRKWGTRTRKVVSGDLRQNFELSGLAIRQFFESIIKNQFMRDVSDLVITDYIKIPKT